MCLLICNLVFHIYLSSLEFIYFINFIKLLNCRCETHHERLRVYCWTCKTCICHQCALWGGTVSNYVTYKHCLNMLM